MRNISRAAFVTLAAASGAWPRIARAQTDADPATNSTAPALRVLLGRGDAQPAGPTGFYYDGRPYRGSFQRLGDGSIVNVVDLEQYLYAVVPHEMTASWPPTALQTQAICARTYVLQRSDPRREYDLVPSELDQVYAGVAGESPAGRAAVDATSGQVLRFGAGYASVAYSSCCGGHTESSADAWGGAFFPYLAGVACSYCSQSPNYRWSVTVALADIAQRFAAQLSDAGALRDVRVADVDPSGRARTFELVADRSVTVKGTTFRLAVGPRVVRSLLLTGMRTEPQSAAVQIDGSGLGHGVGMCQWGARGMAQLGRSAQEVLAFYFPGTTIARA